MVETSPMLEMTSTYTHYLSPAHIYWISFPQSSFACNDAFLIAFKTGRVRDCRLGVETIELKVCKVSGLMSLFKSNCMTAQALATWFYRCRYQIRGVSLLSGRVWRSFASDYDEERTILWAKSPSWGSRHLLGSCIGNGAAQGLYDTSPVGS
jgi:hypothetical protein